MKDDAARLRARKQDILHALRVLEADHADGQIEDGAYAAARQRYEYEAAELLERLDALAEETGAQADHGAAADRAEPWHRTRWLQTVVAAVVCLAIVVTLFGAIHPRSPGGMITGSVGQSASGPKPATADVQAAERDVYRHPRDYDALVRLGTAYLQSGRLAEADMSYEAAMHINATRAEAPTFHAMLLGAIKQYGPALAFLKRVERNHPDYARAWLMDGILSSHTRTGRAHAVRAWLRFLLLAPDSDLAPKVRHWIAQLRRGKR